MAQLARKVQKRAPRASQNLFPSSRSDDRPNWKICGDPCRAQTVCVRPFPGRARNGTAGSKGQKQASRASRNLFPDNGLRVRTTEFEIEFPIYVFGIPASVCRIWISELASRDLKVRLRIPRSQFDFHYHGIWNRDFILRIWNSGFHFQNMDFIM